MKCKKYNKEFEEYVIQEKTFANGTKHNAGYCPECGKFLQYVSKGGEDRMYFGKYKGETIKEIAKKDKEYLEWIINEFDGCKESLKKKIKKYI